ncbi:hypothetical protein PpBr36_04130 [Pyricularia pennisetigena]|uniref:hypothetical protein n=1 Tax=Pyricularia pennisetigena TaxID=1578925 RepID=UPI001152913C|nr:hypothetical protein PpBr36_04130 [Pyricularia pennisetigena]TLS26861.1 hypothetical protein PpBr36_04130 [Pyricularia pennisetigena]
MCYEEIFYKDCGHPAYKDLVFCDYRRVDRVTGELVRCSSSEDGEFLDIIRSKVPGYCNNDECWLKSRVRYGWRCHKCSHTNRRRKGRFCRGRSCRHEVCERCDPSYLLCCYDGVPVERGANCDACLRRSCTKCEYRL